MLSPPLQPADANAPEPFQPSGSQQPGPRPQLPPLRVGLLGLGTVGLGTFTVLQRNRLQIERRLGRVLQVSHVAARNTARATELVGPDVQVIADAMAVATHPDVDVVVEAVGGTSDAFDWLSAALAAGKPVVTANKALLAERGHELLAVAQRHGQPVAYEGAVAVSIPIIKALREGLAANRIEWLAGIINGTSNFVLTAMCEQGVDFAQALTQAQALGYAEADPRFDVDGLDAAHKLTLLAAVAFGMPLRHDAVHVQGIADLQAADATCAQALGFRLKLLGIARRSRDVAGAVELRVHPALIPDSHLLAGVNGALNGVVVHGDASGPTVHCGAGAGGEQTASAVVADLMDLARLHTARLETSNQLNATKGLRTGPWCPQAQVPVLGVHPWAVDHLPVVPMAEVRCEHVLRLRVLASANGQTADPMTQACVATCLDQAGVPCVSWHWWPEPQNAPTTETAARSWGQLAVLTAPVADSRVQTALAALSELPNSQPGVGLLDVHRALHGGGRVVSHLRVERLA